jgi:flavodoxin
MNALIVYDSWFGNTAQVAHAIGAGMETGEADVRHLSEARIDRLDEASLLVVGGPTHRHRESPHMSQFLRRLTPDALGGTAVAAFDTRYGMPRWKAARRPAGSPDGFAAQVGD